MVCHCYCLDGRKGILQEGKEASLTVCGTNMSYQSNSCSCSLFALQQENYRKDLSLKDAEVMALSTLKEVMEEKVMHDHLH